VCSSDLYIGIALFLGLTAYDNQRIKELHYELEGSPAEENVGILGALILYMNFVNLFIYMLRIFGKRRG
jgi:FtsH-binding integral membrane protein